MEGNVQNASRKKVVIAVVLTLGTLLGVFFYYLSDEERFRREIVEILPLDKG